jgi:hypothetical protein
LCDAIYRKLRQKSTIERFIRIRELERRGTRCLWSTIDPSRTIKKQKGKEKDWAGIYPAVREPFAIHFFNIPGFLFRYIGEVVYILWAWVFWNWFDEPPNVCSYWEVFGAEKSEFFEWWASLAKWTKLYT